MRRVALIAFAVLAVLPQLNAENWPGWRGPRGDGSSSDPNVPIKWSGTDNVTWKTQLPGKGHSSPIIWDNAIFVTSAIEDTSERVLMRIDRTTGAIKWKRVVLVADFEGIHRLNSRASSTPLTDGERVYVSFLDGRNMFIAAYDFDGNQLWQTRPGVFASKHGYCSSPILWKDTIIVNGDHDGPAYIVSLDRKTGKTAWKIERPNNVRSYSVPLIRTIDGRDQMIVSGSKCVASYDPTTGKQHWILDGPTEQFVATVVYNGDLIFMTCGFPQRHMMGIDPRGSGNITNTHVAWHTRKNCSYVPSPVWIDKYFINVDDRGIATALDAKTGDEVWSQKLRRKQSASLLTANGLIYILGDDGSTSVVKPGPTYNEIARNSIGENAYASPAISGGQIFIRGSDHLFCIGKGVSVSGP